MPVAQNEGKKEAAPSTVIRRRARTVVGSPAKAESTPVAKTDVSAAEPAREVRESRESRESGDAKPAKPIIKSEGRATSKRVAHGDDPVLNNLSNADVPAPVVAPPSPKFTTGESVAEAVSSRAPRPGAYQAKIISRPPPPPKGLPKQDLTEDDIAKDLLGGVPANPDGTPGAKPAVPGAVVEDPRRSKGKRRHEVSRRTLDDRPDPFGRTNRGRHKKKKPSGQSELKQTEITTPKAIKRIVRMGDQIAVGDLAKRMGVKAADLIKKLFDMGTMVTLNQNIDFDTAAVICADFEFEVVQSGFEEETVIEEKADLPEDLVHRATIVTVMGHVDHGKTTLLDSIRKSDVAAGESGGITQHIGAYEVHLDSGKKVAFLDTPGHAAFTAMRARGAKITDIIILVVAADDGIMPQTIEAINHAKAAHVPIIVAINKVDKPGADIEKIKKALTEYELIPEEWGGTTLIVPVSAKTGQGLPVLLENLALQSEIMELKANPKKRAKGAVIEARLERGRGPVATIMVLDGTLNTGDFIVLGPFYGRVRAMNDDRGRVVKTAGPSTPVEIQGINGVPEAGEAFIVLPDEKEAKLVAEHRARKLRDTELRKTSLVSLDTLYARIQESGLKELKVIIKADVQGSAEALTAALNELNSDKIRMNVLHAAAGAVNESDVNLAKASDSILISFNVRPDPKAKNLAETMGVELRVYSIIYEVVDEIRALMEGKLAPTLKEALVGHAEVREVFRISKIGSVAGCMVTDGKIMRNSKIRLLRDRVPVHDGKISNLRRFKDDAREVAAGTECGISLENFQDIKVGDILEAYQVEEFATKL